MAQANAKEPERTRPEECKCLVKIVVIDIDKNVLRLRADLLVCAQHDDQESSGPSK